MSDSHIYIMDSVTKPNYYYYYYIMSDSHIYIAWTVSPNQIIIIIIILCLTLIYTLHGQCHQTKLLLLLLYYVWLSYIHCMDSVTKPNYYYYYYIMSDSHIYIAWTVSPNQIIIIIIILCLTLIYTLHGQCHQTKLLLLLLYYVWLSYIHCMDSVTKPNYYYYYYIMSDSHIYIAWTVSPNQIIIIIIILCLTLIYTLHGQCHQTKLLLLLLYYVWLSYIHCMDSVTKPNYYYYYYIMSDSHIYIAWTVSPNQIIIIILCLTYIYIYIIYIAWTLSPNQIIIKLLLCLTLIYTLHGQCHQIVIIIIILCLTYIYIYYIHCMNIVTKPDYY